MAPDPATPIPATDTAPAAPVKPGWQTTEFWLHAVVTVCGIVMAALPSNSKPVQIAGMVMSVLSALGYGATRASVKNGAAILLCVLGLALGGCCSGGGAPLKAEVDAENALMAELSAYVQADPKKSDDLKKAEALRIKAHLDLFNSLTK